FGYPLSQLPGNPAPDLIGRSFGNVSAYSESEPQGAQPTTVTVGAGYSLPLVLSAVGVAPGSFSFAEIATPGGRSLLFSSADAAAPVGVWDDGHAAHLVVPSSGSEPGATFSAEKITITLHGGALLTVDASSTPKSPKAEERVRFRATVT